jgi:hypothetical protein
MADEEAADRKSEKGDEMTGFELLLSAIVMVESGGDPNAIGDGGKAIGPYQIHQAYWIDGCKALGVKWDYWRAKDERTARRVVTAYILRYAGEGASLEKAARIHNGGPQGHRNPATLIYWEKVKREMDRIRSQTK